MPATGWLNAFVDAASHGDTPTAGSLPQQVPSETHGMCTPGAISVVHPLVDRADTSGSAANNSSRIAVSRRSSVIGDLVSAKTCDCDRVPRSRRPTPRPPNIMLAVALSVSLLAGSLVEETAPVMIRVGVRREAFLWRPCSRRGDLPGRRPRVVGGSCFDPPPRPCEKKKLNQEK